jgi:hypothetical protein
MKSFLRFVFLMLFVRCAFAYELSTEPRSSPAMTFYVDLFSDGVDYNELFANAAYEWADAGFYLTVNPNNYYDSCDQYDGVSTAVFSYDICGDEFGEGTLATTMMDSGVVDGNVDIYFNNNEYWDFYWDPWVDDLSDFRRVALHELGHALGLEHEDDVPSIMSTYADDITNLQSDDYDGVKALYYTETISLSSQSSRDGWLLESKETSNKGGKLNSSDKLLIVGDSAADQQYRSVLSFDTSGIPNGAVITKAVLTLKKAGSTGAVTPLSSLVADIRTNYFGSSSSLVVSDFEAAASKSSAVKLTANGTVYKATLSTSAKTYISKTGLTQFKLRFAKDDNDDKGADYLKFYSGNSSSSSSRPSLVIEYYVP